jgi:hypothetical protein
MSNLILIKIKRKDLIPFEGSIDRYLIYQQCQNTVSLNEIIQKTLIAPDLVKYHLEWLLQKQFIQLNLIGYQKTDKKIITPTPKQQEPYLYSQYVEIWNQFLLQTIGIGVAEHWKENKIEPKSLKLIIEKMNKIHPNQPQQALDAFLYLLQNFQHLQPFYRKYNLHFINRNFNDIIAQIKQHAQQQNENESRIQKQIQQFFAHNR